MNNLTKLESAVKAFSTAAIEAGNTTNDETVNKIKSLAKEIMECVTDHRVRSDRITECSIIVDKASEMLSLTEGEQRTKIEKQAETLTNDAISIITSELLVRKNNPTWLLDFFNLKRHIRTRLLQNSQTSELFSEAIWAAGPNFIIKSKAKVTLSFMFNCVF